LARPLAAELDDEEQAGGHAGPAKRDGSDAWIGAVSARLLPSTDAGARSAAAMLDRLLPRSMVLRIDGESPPRGGLSTQRGGAFPWAHTYEGMRTRLRVPVRTATARPPMSRTRPNAAAMPIPKSSHANDVDAEVEATGVDACSVSP
jgi:hypothetical protein